MTADSKAEKISVPTGSGSGKLIEVLGAINVGDNVIVRGAERVRVAKLARTKLASWWHTITQTFTIIRLMKPKKP